MSPRVVQAWAVVCYLVALAGAGAFVGRVLLLGLDIHLDLFRLPAAWAWTLDVTFLVLFGLQHSVMARASFKARWARLVPPALERSLYAAISGVLLLALAVAWQPVDESVWWRGPRWLVAVPLAAAASLVLVNLRFDHAGLFGLRQAWAGECPEPPEKLIIAGPYRYVRHPLMACLLAFLWTQPTMATTLALLDGGMTLYIFIGLFFEERDLAARFHPEYAAYRRRVPALVPWRPPLTAP
jgi:protein-S-isoprenylcysteine O-methyltransferase Ste14